MRTTIQMGDATGRSRTMDILAKWTRVFQTRANRHKSATRTAKYCTSELLYNQSDRRAVRSIYKLASDIDIGAEPNRAPSTGSAHGEHVCMVMHMLGAIWLIKCDHRDVFSLGERRRSRQSRRHLLE